MHLEPGVPPKSFYIPLKWMRVDIQEMLEEIQVHVPQNRLMPGCGLTVTENMAGRIYGFDRFNGNSQYDQHGVRRVRSGERDEDVIHWPLQLEKSYIRRVGEELSSCLGLPPLPRVRTSTLIGGMMPNIGMHLDCHTPFRVHIALKTSPGTFWHFLASDGRRMRVHQPADGIPVLLETGSTQHAVEIEKGTVRMHLWYQWYHPMPEHVLEHIRHRF